MEYQKPHELIHRLLDARNRIRTSIAIETVLMDRIGTLPEDNFCHQARESYQLGAGYAWLMHETDFNETDSTLDSSNDVLGMGKERFLDACNAFHQTKPRNKYASSEEEAFRRNALNHAVQSVLDADGRIDVSPEIDLYDLEEQLAFIEGVATVHHAALIMRPPLRSATYGT